MAPGSVRKFLLAAGAAVLAVAAPGGTAYPQQGVTVHLFQFLPRDAEVGSGTRVVWINQDDITHTITSGVPGGLDGRFRHQLAGKGTMATVELTQPGVYPYFCERHQSMRGEIRVK